MSRWTSVRSRWFRSRRSSLIGRSDVRIQSVSRLGCVQTETDVRFRPEGAATHQPRATPWESIHQTDTSPERARHMRIPASVSPFQGWGRRRSLLPQGVALGWIVAAPVGRQMTASLGGPWQLQCIRDCVHSLRQHPSGRPPFPPRNAGREIVRFGQDRRPDSEGTLARESFPKRPWRSSLSTQY